MGIATWVAFFFLHQDNCDFEVEKRKRGHFVTLIKVGLHVISYISGYISFA